MRNKYSKEFEDEMKMKAHIKKIDELLQIAKNKYNYSISKKQLRQFLYKRKIRYKDYDENKARKMGLNKPIGSERIKPDGMVQVKVAKDKWEYKQRLIYEKYYNVKLTSDDYIIFLDQDRTNFDVDNLIKVTRRESSILANQKLFSKNPVVTETGIQVAKLIIEIKNKKKEKKEWQN